jgi:hypothetical protein
MTFGKGHQSALGGGESTRVTGSGKVIAKCEVNEMIPLDGGEEEERKMD